MPHCEHMHAPSLLVSSFQILTESVTCPTSSEIVIVSGNFGKQDIAIASSEGLDDSWNIPSPNIHISATALAISRKTHIGMSNFKERFLSWTPKWQFKITAEDISQGNLLFCSTKRSGSL